MRTSLRLDSMLQVGKKGNGTGGVVPSTRGCECYQGSSSTSQPLCWTHALSSPQSMWETNHIQVLHKYHILPQDGALQPPTPSSWEVSRYN